MQIEETVLDQIRSRPRFKIYTDISREDYVQFLQKKLRDQSQEFSGNVNKEMAIINVKTAENPFWKPNLSLRAENDEEKNKTVITGIFGPSSAVWTFFMFLYFIFSILWMVFFSVWFVEKQIKSTDFQLALPLSFLMLIFIGITYAASRIGQIKAKSEIEKLRYFAENSVGKL